MQENTFDMQVMAYIAQNKYSSFLRQIEEIPFITLAGVSLNDNGRAYILSNVAVNEISTKNIFLYANTNIEELVQVHKKKNFDMLVFDADTLSEKKVSNVYDYADDDNLPDTILKVSFSYESALYTAIVQQSSISSLELDGMRMSDYTTINTILNQNKNMN